MDSVAYAGLQHRISWRHAKTERHNARAATQYVGPGDDAITLDGMLVPGISGNYASMERIVEMANTGDAWPLADGTGKIYGIYQIVSLDRNHHYIWAGGVPRYVDFSLSLDRVD
jgi:phage protein U